jgi:hypothetical protein
MTSGDCRLLPALLSSAVIEGEFDAGAKSRPGCVCLNDCVG